MSLLRHPQSPRQQRRQARCPTQRRQVVGAHCRQRAAEAALTDPENDIVILDEINNALYFELVTVEAVQALLAQKLKRIEVVLTGRNAPAELIELADLVTECREIKHPFQKGVNSRKGIEY